MKSRVSLTCSAVKRKWINQLKRVESGCDLLFHMIEEKNCPDYRPMPAIGIKMKMWREEKFHNWMVLNLFARNET